MDADIYALVAKYGFKNLHIRLEEIMRDEYAYFQTKFQAPGPLVVNEIVQEIPVLQKKVRKVRTKAPVQASEVQEVQVSSDNTEVKDVIVSEKAFRDPKEMKEFQRCAVEAKRKENEAAGLEPSHFLTKDNLRQWIEVDGHTYAWVAREKSGCPEAQVSATAQMMGIKSKISQKKGRIMTGN
jgi:hypothetical protein